MEELHGPGEDGADDERAGLCIPAVPEGGEQTRLDVGLSCSRLRHSGQSVYHKEIVVSCTWVKWWWATIALVQ